ncbi:type II secretion system F family protein [Clostridioides difficile]|uniref:type II secretion system F family protein n=1 Tax=Clostridioides difficile TaxID=1496 RepID=UPI0021C6E406|nr:type II secretion system F family protein [Clostridioides difficile]UUV15291.1 type II secretion system F family protein [Clostridioides difficile]
MKSFKYTVIKEDGKKQTDVIEANDFNEARNLLRKRNLRVIEIKESKNKNIRLSSRKRKKDLGADQISHFCRQFAIIVSSGINSISGLETLARRSTNITLREEINRIVAEIKVGSTIADSMLSSKSKFPKLLGAMVATGEATGKLDEVLKSMASFYASEHRVKQKLRNAATYPLIVLISSFIMIFIFTTFMVPKMINSITTVGATLPLITRIVMGFGIFMKKFWIIVLLVIILFIYQFKKYLKTPVGRAHKDRVINKIPVLGKGINCMVATRFSRALYLFVSTGYPLVQGLDYIIDSVNNTMAEKILASAKDGITRGEGLAENLERYTYFDSVLVQMIAIGEQTGELENISRQMAEFYEYESEIYLNRMASMIEPVLIIAVGIIVSILVVSIFMPMLSIYDAM